jgi:Sulfotransferase family
MQTSATHGPMQPSAANVIGDAGARAAIDVVYLLGMPHSGTTLLSNLLGEFEGCVSIGELCFLWKRWVTGEGRCGCGRPFRECPFWHRVLVEGFGEGLDPRPLAELSHRLNVTRQLPAAIAWAAGHGAGARDVDRYRAALARLYPTIAKVAESPIVIDSSKAPGIAMLLDDVPGIRAYVVHVVRDSRGALFSHRWRGSPKLPGRSKLLLWDIWHLFAELRWSRHPRYIRVRYEDFVAAPEDTLKRILAFLGHPARRSPMLARDRARLGPHHTVDGNPNRFTTGEIRLSQDIRWQDELSFRDRALAMAMTGPLLLRHGYLARAVRGSRVGTAGRLRRSRRQALA